MHGGSVGVTSGLEGTVFYEPQPGRHEDVLKAYLEQCWPKYYPKK